MQRPDGSFRAYAGEPDRSASANEQSTDHEAEAVRRTAYVADVLTAAREQGLPIPEAATAPPASICSDGQAGMQWYSGIPGVVLVRLTRASFSDVDNLRQSCSEAKNRAIPLGLFSPPPHCTRTALIKRARRPRSISLSDWVTPPTHRPRMSGIFCMASPAPISTAPRCRGSIRWRWSKHQAERRQSAWRPAASWRSPDRGHCRQLLLSSRRESTGTSCVATAVSGNLRESAWPDLRTRSRSKIWARFR